ncbi:ribonucleotide reductase subunit alpha [Halomonas llamarensis]|uniref:Ribonucleotide reductase subunit alpha n=1 Tax=Halomonas llamarensis TaxID=2945104 RepID=A0ABT0SUE5_9GAMM|nr:ribonucleotide reductase subunit alpha [Halomonas llamarensis]MCL7931465.1 ribonucleotide reductase subunit alpha [Halomonas llamarensis]
MLTTLDDLIQEARLQPVPQRLLFVLTRAELPDFPSDAQRESVQRGEGGVLTPVLCVDKCPTELDNMAVLAEESKATGIDWDIALVAAMDHPGSEDVIESRLSHLVSAVQMGDIGRMVAFNRQGDAIELTTPHVH